MPTGVLGGPGLQPLGGAEAPHSPARFCPWWEAGQAWALGEEIFGGLCGAPGAAVSASPRVPRGPFCRSQEGETTEVDAATLPRVSQGLIPVLRAPGGLSVVEEVEPMVSSVAQGTAGPKVFQAAGSGAASSSAGRGMDPCF